MKQSYLEILQLAKSRRNKDGSITKGKMHTPSKLGRRFNVW